LSVSLIIFIPQNRHMKKPPWFDIRDLFLFGGLSMLGYGLYLHWGEWLALIVCGVLLMIIGYLMRDK